MHQQTFVDLIKQSHSDHLNLVETICEELSLSKDSAYRRLRCETPFTMDEYLILCNVLGLDAHDIIKIDSQHIRFRQNVLYRGDDSFLHYLKNMSVVLTVLKKQKGKLIYAAEDVPVFRHFEQPTLSSFKFFYWMKAVLDEDGLSGSKFDVNRIHPDLIDISTELVQLYSEVEVEEIWTEDTVNSTLKQIQYFQESGQFENNETCELILQDFTLLIQKLERQAEQKESANENFKLYNSEVLIGNNCILLHTEQRQSVFLSHNTFNTLSTSDSEFCEETRLWMDNLMRKSQLISGVGEKQRFLFFKSLYQKIEDTKSRLLQ